MIDLTTLLNDHLVTVVVLACLIVGYLIKHTFEFIPNKYIPTILAIFGAGINVAVSGTNIEAVVYGAFMGLASTGFHEMFRNFVEGRKEEGNE